MNALPSTEFRKRFARLEETTEVTVNGHLIGTWVPAAVAWHVEETRRYSDGAPGITLLREPEASRSFGQSHPVPKPARK